MRFHDEETALEVLRAAVTRLVDVQEAARVGLSDDDTTRIEQLQDRLVGLRYVLKTTTEQLAAVLRLTVEND